METLHTIWFCLSLAAIVSASSSFFVCWLEGKDYKLGVQHMAGQWLTLALAGIFLSASLL